jgi:NET1-associated nuclear protein 1 (U3 small nucleolar RNA-associated protein 17)
VLTPDLVAWSNTSQAYTRVIAHPSAPIFITVHHTPSPRTVLTSWSPTSPKATPGHRIHHTLRDLVLLPPSTSSSVDPAKSLNFIGITTSGEILRFGDGVSKSDIGARGINVESVKTNSIWQEMFGKDAFVDLADALPQSSDSQDQDGASAVQARAHAAGRPTAVFDGPSHTLPPIGMLFDAFIEEILGAPTQAPQEPQATASGETILFESAIHAEDEVTEQKVKSKVVTDEEVKELESLFRDVLANSEL